MTTDFADLRNGVVLAELGGWGDGPYCAEHGAGAALVIMGTYVVDPGDKVAYPKQFVFKPGRKNSASYLEQHVAAARKGGAKVGVSVISVRLADSVDFLAAAEQAGADYVSLCAHSSMEMFTSVGLGLALLLRENRESLSEWACAIRDAVRIPVIFKIGVEDLQETLEAIAVLDESGIPIVHVNVDTTDDGSEGLHTLGEMKGHCKFLIAGGGISDVAGARRALAAGADAVAIGTAAMKDTSLCGRIQAALRP